MNKIKSTFLLRLLGIVWGFILVFLIGFGAFSNAKIGTLMWGPTTDFWAMSIAISDIKYGLKGGLGYREISQSLANTLTTKKSDLDVNDEGTELLVGNAKLVNDAIRSTARVEVQNLNPGPATGGSYITTLAEDVGYANFYNLAFRLFGYGSYSTHYLYFLILSMSIIIYIFAYWRNNFEIAILTLGITALFLETTSSLIFSSSTPSFASNRFLSTLALFPLLYIVVTFLRSEVLSLAGLFFLLLQILLLVFAISCRSSATWAVITILVVAIFYGIKEMMPPKLYNYFLYCKDALRSLLIKPFNFLLFTKSFFKMPTLIVGPIILVALVFCNSLFERIRLDAVYFSDDLLPHHFVWHNAYMALSLHPGWKDNLPMQELAGLGGDAIPFTASSVVLKNRGIANTGGANGGNFKTRLHDRTVRDELLSFIKNHPLYTFELYAYYKPIAIFTTLVSGIKSIKPIAWFIALISVLISAFLLFYDHNKYSIGSSIAFIIVFLGACLPGIWAYSAVYLMGDQLWSFLLLTLFLFTQIIFFGIKKLI